MALVVVKQLVQAGQHIRCYGTAVDDAGAAGLSQVINFASDIATKTIAGHTYDSLKILSAFIAAGAQGSVLWTLTHQATGAQPFFGVPGGDAAFMDFAAGPSGGLRNPKVTAWIGNVNIDTEGTGFVIGDRCFFFIEAELTD